MKNVVKGLDAVNNFFGNISAYLCFLMALTVVAEVICRYFFKSPLIWSMEVNQLLFSATTLLAGGFCLLRDGHVRVDLFYPKFSSKTQAIIELLTYPLPVIVCLVLVWLGTKEFWLALVTGYKTEVVGIPLWVNLLVLAMAGVLLGIQIVARYLRNILILIGKS